MARLAFLGSPDAAVPSLEALVAAGHELGIVVSRADARRGRGSSRSASPVKRAALDLGLPVTDDLDAVVDARAELAVVVAYGRIIPGRVLDALAMVNVHFSLLPRWRGAAPVERAVLAGDTVTGVSLMRLDAGLDTGPVVATVAVEIGEHEHVAPLSGRLSRTGAQLLVDALAGGVGALGAGHAQSGEPTYAEKVKPDELRLQWERPATELARVVRLDRAWTTWRGERLRVLAAEALGAGTTGADTVDAGAGADHLAPGVRRHTLVGTGVGLLRLLSVQPAGRRPMDADAWSRGVREDEGIRFGADGGDR